MASYYRESEKYDESLPPIRRQRARSPTLQTTVDDLEYEERYRYTRDREPLFHPRPHSPGPTAASCRKQAIDMQEQLRIYREELAKKDHLITELTRIETPRHTRIATSTTAIEDMYSNERMASMASIKSDNAALNVRCDALATQVREMQAQLDSREEKIRELKMQLEISRENEAKHKALTATFREKLAGFEGEVGNLEDVASRSSVAVQSLQRQNAEAKARIIELERRNRELQDERERIDHDRVVGETRVTEVITRLNSVLALESCDTEIMVNRVTDIMQENAMLRGKLTTMKEYLTSAEVENKASRETIMRLVTETEREQRNVSKYTLDMDNLRLERDRAVEQHRELERELSVVRGRLEASLRAGEASRTELEERESRYSRVDIKMRELELQARNTDAALRSFREDVARLLQVEAREEQIRERISALIMSSRDKGAHIDMLEAKVSKLSGSLEAQLDRGRASEEQNRRREDEWRGLQEQTRRLQEELAAADALRDGLRTDKERYLRFLEQAASAMKLDGVMVDAGMDGAIEAILVRAEQLVRLEADALADRKTQIYSLQRKLKSMKAQLENKDLHMDLLRKKTVDLEERLSGASVLEREKEDEYVKNKKLVKLCEKYKHEINECRLEIRDLKARLLESSDMRSRTLEQEQAMSVLERKIGELEDVRGRQAEELRELRAEMETTHSRLSEKRETAHHTVQNLSSELHTTKTALQEVTNRERQLLDLRQVVARMLGLDVNTLAVPDYEILSRLEKLILANQSNAATAIALDTALEDLGDGFRAGYNDASRALTSGSFSGEMNGDMSGHASRALATATRQRTTIKQRSRSASPNRKRDTRSY